MFAQKTRRHSYVVLLVFTLILSSSAVAGSLFYNDSLPWIDFNAIENVTTKPTHEEKLSAPKVVFSEAPKASEGAMLFTTIIQNANEEATCPNDGSTLAKFFLCGTSDVRTLTLSTTGTLYEWERLDTNTCAPTVVDDCPTTNAANSCWTNVGGDPTYDLNAPGEYRVRVDSGQYYYFKASQNPLNPQLVFENIICGETGRVEVTNVPRRI